MWQIGSTPVSQRGTAALRDYGAAIYSFMKNYRKYKNKKKLLSDIEDIYRDRSGYSDRFERKRVSLSKIIFLFFLLIGLGASAVLAGYYVFSPPVSDNFQQSDIYFEIKGNDLVVSGEEIFYIVDYQNESNVDMVNNEIKLVYPEGFVVKMVEPSPDDEQYNIWKFDKIRAKEKGQIKLQGYLIGETGERKELEGVLKYNPSNTSASFSKNESLEIQIKSTYLSLDLDVPVNCVEGRKESLKIKYFNNSSKSIDNLRLILFYPKNSSLFLDDLKLENADTDDRYYEYNQYILDIEQMEGNSEEVLEMNMVLNLNDTEKTPEIKAQFGYVGNDDKFLLQNEKEEKIFILKGSLSVDLILNGITSNGFANAGDTLNYTLVLENGGNAVLGNVEAKVLVDDNEDLIAWKSLQYEERGVMQDKEISWNYENNDNLSEIEPGEEVELNFSVDLKNIADIESDNIVENNIVSWGEVEVGMTGGLKSDKLLKSSSVNIALNTFLDFESEVRYFDESGEPVGSGPLPPKVGEITTYKVFWSLSSSLHEARNIIIKAKLPEDIIWDEKVSVESGELYFDRALSQVIWSVPKLPVDLDKPLYGNFNISIKPIEEDADVAKILLENIVLAGEDSVTSSELKYTNGFFDTDLKYDEIGKGNGVVQGQ